ncbi:MAG: hypothetical protein JSS87_09210 [Acidobacteria bacterium]|nr:hypothetical protein [Acidobacteriota bacterium]
MSTSSLVVRVFDGTGQIFPAGTQLLLTVIDGNQKQIIRQEFTSGQIRVQGLPFYNNFGDNYAVIAFVEGFRQAGYAPVKLSPAEEVTVDLMLIPKDPVFNYAGFSWEAAKARLSFLAPLPGQSEEDAKQRFSQMWETNGSKSLACMLNLVTAMDAIDLGGRSPVSYIRQIRWDHKFPAQDRFFAYCDAALIDAVRTAAAKGIFEPEHGAGIFHPGATLSWKQVEYPEANVQLTFHTNPLDCVSGSNWVTVEPDIDYYKDLAAHSILEVCRNEATGSLTEPAEVFVLRWMEQKRLGRPEFSPGYTLRNE